MEGAQPFSKQRHSSSVLILSEFQLLAFCVQLLTSGSGGGEREGENELLLGFKMVPGIADVDGGEGSQPKGGPAS